MEEVVSCLSFSVLGEPSLGAFGTERLLILGNDKLRDLDLARD